MRLTVHAIGVVAIRNDLGGDGRQSFSSRAEKVYAMGQEAPAIPEFTQPNGSVRFGVFEANLGSGELRKHGIRLKLHDQPFQVLAMLVACPGELVTREEIQQRLWPSGTFVDFENGLNSAVNRLRDALGDSADQPKFIETIPRRGYRFIAPVEPRNGQASSVGEVMPAQSIHGLRWWHWSNRSAWLVGVSLAGIALLCILALTGAVPSLTLLRAGRQIHSLVVVASASPDQDLQSAILAEGASESVIRTLRWAPNLKVIAEHTPVAPDQGLAVGRSLKCDAVLSLQGERQGDRFRVRMEALNSNTGDRLWEETVTGRVTDAGWLNANVSEVVVRRFHAGGEHEQRQVVSSAAFQEYVRGRYFWNKRTAPDLQEAFASFRAAIQDDPNFALAYAGLAQTYAVADLHDSAYRGREETFREARDAAEHAIAIDPGLASAHAALAQILRNHDRDMAGAEREYLKAIELDGSDATAHQWYAEFLAINARFDEAVAEIDRAHELDPLSAVITAVCGTIRINARRYAESLPFAEEALRLDPHYYDIYDNVVKAMEGQGRYLDAFDAMAKEAEVSGDPGTAAAAREDKAAYLRGGVRALYRQRLRRVQAQQALPNRQYNLATFYCRLGEVENCLHSLEQALTERSEGVTNMKIDPSFDIIHDDPRYTALLVRFGFTP